MCATGSHSTAVQLNKPHEETKLKNYGQAGRHEAGGSRLSCFDDGYGAWNRLCQRWSFFALSYEQFN
jgi:hypothetical protein